jgi:hypothetical protein
LKITLVKNSKFARLLKVDGIVLFPFIFFSETRPSIKTINHELIHILQVRREGSIRFYFNYLKEYWQFRLKGYSHTESYLAISYEVEAYGHQNDLTYTGLWSIEFTV